MSPPLLILLLLCLSTTLLTPHCQAQPIYYGNGYPGYPEHSGDIATPGDTLYCTPTFTTPTPQLLTNIGVRYEYNAVYTDTYHIIMGLYEVSDATGNGVHTLVAAANYGEPTAFSGDGPANVKIQLEVGNFTYINESLFSGLMQPSVYYAGCFNTDQLCPILWQNLNAGPQPNGGSDPTVSYPYDASLPLQIATVDELNGGEFVYVTTVNASSDDIGSGGEVAAAASVVGDPQFVGLLGQSYQVHGIDGAVYNLISDVQVQVNARFTFIDQGQCLRDASDNLLFICWSHPGSYLSQLAVHTAAGDSVVVSAGAAEHGFSSVAVNGVTMEIGEMTSLHRAALNLTALTITYTNLRTLTVANAGLYTLTIQNSDHFLNILQLEVASMRRLRDVVQSHGLLGQTWRLRRDGKEVRVVEGVVDDYVVSEGGVLGCDFVYNKFDCK